MALTFRQRRVYQHRCTIYRLDRAINPSTGVVADDTIKVVARDVPCHFTYTQNDNERTNVGRVKTRMALTEDFLHLPSYVDIRGGDLVKDTTPLNMASQRADNSNRGEVHRVMGAPNRIPSTSRRPTNKQFVRLMEEEHPAFASLL